MSEEGDFNATSKDDNDSSGEDASAEAALKKKTTKIKKKKPSSSATTGSNDGKKTAKPRRKNTEDGGKSSTSSSSRRSSADSRGDANVRKDSSLSLISKASTRRGSKTVMGGDENASAATSGSGGSLMRKSSRNKSPTRTDKKTPGSGARSKSGGGFESGEGTINEGSSSVWDDVPSFGGGSKNNNESAFGGSAFDGGNSGFSDFHDTAFSDNAFFGASEFAQNTSSKSRIQLGGSQGYDGQTPSFFDSKAAFGQDAAFGNTPVFGGAHRDALDKSPLKDPPQRKMGKLSLLKKTVFSQHFACQPVKNPLNGNIIFCTSKDGEMFIQEVNPMRGFVQVLSSPILTPELHRKVTTKYSRSAYGVDNVLKLCVGMHQSHGQPRVRVVAVIDILVVDSKHILRALAVWQWGYGSTHPVSLQFLLSPPSGTDYAYDPESILAADNIVFVAGASVKGPCVFMCKPSVRESWSANFLAPSGKIIAMAVTSSPKRMYPYLAVGMADGSLSVWTYAAALKQAASKKNEPFRRLLYPLCRLDALWVLNGLQPTSFTEDIKQKAVDKADAGMCTNLEWLPPQPSTSSLLMLAAGFQGGIAVFHVALPFISDEFNKEHFIPVPPPTQATQLTSTPQMRPFAAIRFPSLLQDVFVSWIDFGPHSNPCLAILQHGRSSDDEPGRVVLGAINLMEYQKTKSKSKEGLTAFRMLASTAWKSKSKAFPLGLLSCSGLSAVVCHGGEGITTLFPSFSNKADDPVVLSLRHPVFSNPPGVGSTGEVIGTDTESDKEGILHVFSVTQSDLTRNELQPDILTWSRPARRHWVCRTVCGDRKETKAKEETKEASQFGEDEEIVVGGSLSDVVCELEGKALSGLVPYRIVRCRGSTSCAVLFRSALGHTSQGILSGLSMECVTIALIEATKKAVAELEIVEGRDIAFIPGKATASTRALVLSRDGGSVTIYDKTSNRWKAGLSCRPILGVESDDNYVEALRLFLVTNEKKYGLVVVGKRHSDDRTCLVCGPMGTSDQVANDGWVKMLPEMSPSQPCLWLSDGDEQVLSLISLPFNTATPHKIAVSTSSRVMILNFNLDVLAQTKMTLASGALSPLGSSTVSFCSRDCKIRYLSCLDKKLSTGTLATLPLPRLGYATYLLMAIRSERILYFEWHHGSNLVEHKDDPDCFMLPTAVTKPAMLLEPLIANAICECAKSGVSTAVLRGVIEKFGRSGASITHGDDAGIGNGTGITPRVYELLSRHDLNQAASWLLTGRVQFDRSTNSKILPPWMPVSAKQEAALNSDAFLHLVANGDQYLSEYIQSPDQNMPSTLPRPGDPAPYLCREFGQDSLVKGKAGDTIKMLDIAGTESTESMLLQLSLLLELKAGDATDLLKSLSSYDDNSLSRSTGLPTATTSLAALAVTLKERSLQHPMDENQLKRWIKPLAPSLQRGTQFRRVRQRLFGERILGLADGNQIQESKTDPQWLLPCIESRHIWNEGPNKEKENLLLLGSVEEWLGRRRPTLLGKEGVAAAEEQGERVLANILNMDKEEEEESEAGEESDNDSERKGWEEGVGEGRLDEDNLCGYFRFWEGEDDESPWRSEGFSDLSRFQNKAIVVSQGGSLSLQPTTSSCDEGELGKVKILYDLVFEEAGDQEASGLALAATRGNSIDVGMLHKKDHTARQRCTLEFWYYLPPASMVSGDIVLARRTFGEDADDFSKVCIASDKRSMLWEVTLRRTGELEIRTCGGTVLRSDQDNSGNDEGGQADRKDMATFERWNHVCLVFSSRDGGDLSGCSVSLFMMGVPVASSELSMLPPGFSVKDLDDKVDTLMEKSYLVFGLNHAAGFRICELRIWACERSEDDIKMMMREYLDAAEARKKKFRVKIGKNKKGAPKGGLLAAPKPGGLTTPKPGGLAPPKGLSPPKIGISMAPPSTSKSLLGPPKGATPSRSGLLAPPKPGLLAPPKDRSKDAEVTEESTAFGETPSSLSGAEDSNAVGSVSEFDTAFGSFGGETKSDGRQTALENKDGGAVWGNLPETEDDKESQKQSLWESAIPLSQQVRSSAAAALIRGPPATRHFGGNRGGLPDLRGTDRYGVGGIAICGSEKTIVWRDEEDPPALTYPIGASGAIVSDQLDDEDGSEFLCCFLAKDKRMVVFELNSRTVVVELQMTTKLNFWRFLPPEAAESTLAFMLITPVGGFHWMPLDDSPRPRQVWKRGADLQGKKIVSYEEGGTNGLTGHKMISKAGLICVTDSNGTGTLEAWIVPICGDSGAVLACGDVQGAAFCLPENSAGSACLPYLVMVVEDQGALQLNISTILEPESGSLALCESVTSEVLPTSEFQVSDLQPPTLAMGVYPDILVCSLGRIIVVLIRARGAMIAYEFKNKSVQLIAKEAVGHYIIDAVMRYSAIEGSAEIVMLLSDTDNHKDGRIASHFFRSAA